ncbi:hypothetical protein EXVG_00445 [Emiliania huxleyi virus 202]|nr:hypothetical protein EXVG_00445 [Emiliania huxleyi virus 202]AHA54303.1 putative membrane protein [Emiliania huxleyi virus 18]AHA55352.1 putative membrane protein [Emiliania huxleyi virus 156]
MEINRPIATVIMLTIIAVLGLVYSLITTTRNTRTTVVSSDQLFARARQMDAETEVIRAKIIAANENTITRLKKERNKINKSMRGKRSKRLKRRKR